MSEKLRGLFTLTLKISRIKEPLRESLHVFQCFGKDAECKVIVRNEMRV